VALTILLAATGMWLAYRPLARTPRPTTYPKPDTAQGLGRVIASSSDSVARPIAVESPIAATPIPHAVNPTDSAAAAIFAVELMTTNTQAGAILKLQKDGAKLPAATFAPIMIQGARWYKVMSGAYTNRADADSLLVGLRRRNVPRPVAGQSFAYHSRFCSTRWRRKRNSGNGRHIRGSWRAGVRASSGEWKMWLLVGAFRNARPSIRLC
jgi:hypothetical protein